MRGGLQKGALHLMILGMISSLFKNLHRHEDGTYSASFQSPSQQEEILMRKKVADQAYDDYLSEISKHHSICVMDKEVGRFLQRIPQNGVILDAGGCWGWHWRKLASLRPDVKVVIVDFVRENFRHAQNVIGPSLNKNIFLVHADATQLPFEDNQFDGYWTVQTFQHIPAVDKAVSEAHRVLKPNGVFANYSLNSPSLVRTIYRLLGRNFVEEGRLDGLFHIARASESQKQLVGRVFRSNPTTRYSEILFTPELKVSFPGAENVFGKIDSYLSSRYFKSLARQQSFHCVKPPEP
jgi:ubiquinone/menaquinone biosynthesis C-methylase UbiE